MNTLISPQHFRISENHWDICPDLESIRISKLSVLGVPMARLFAQYVLMVSRVTMYFCSHHPIFFCCLWEDLIFCTQVCAVVFEGLWSYLRISNILLDWWWLFCYSVYPSWVVDCSDNPNFGLVMHFFKYYLWIVPIFLLYIDKKVLRGCHILGLPYLQRTAFVDSVFYILLPRGVD